MCSESINGMHGPAFELGPYQLLCRRRRHPLNSTRNSFPMILALCLLIPNATAFIHSIQSPAHVGPSSYPMSRISSPFIFPPRTSLGHLVRRTTRAHAGSSISMCSTTPGALALIECIGRSLPDTWFKMLGSPSTHFALQAFFLASNISYFAAAARIVQCRSRQKLHLAGLMCFVGMISLTFHSYQVILGPTSPVVHAFCLFDTCCAVGCAVSFMLTCGWLQSFRMLPSPGVVAGWLLAFALLAHTGNMYTMAHGSWHLFSAGLAYRMLEEHDERAFGMRSPVIGKELIDGMTSAVVLALTRLQLFLAMRAAQARTHADAVLTAAAPAVSSLRSMSLPSFRGISLPAKQNSS